MIRLVAGVLALALLSGCAVQATGPISDRQSHQAAKANTNIAIHHLRQGALGAAREKIDRALKQDPELIDSHLVAAELELRLDDAQRAEAHYQAALAIDETHGAALNNYASFLCEQGRTEQALLLYDLAADNRLYDGRALALANAGRCLARVGRQDEAAEYWRSALERMPDHPPALRGLAETALSRGDTDSAWALFSRYTAASEETPALLWLGVRIAAAEGDTERVERFAQRLREGYPESEQSARLIE